MKNKLMQTVVGTFLGLLMFFAAAQIFVSGQDKDKQKRTIQGVWETMITPRNCQTGAPLASAFPGRMTLDDGGTMAEYGISPGLTPALRSPGHGLWQRELGWHSYSLKFTFLRYNASGAYIGSQTIRATAELDETGDHFTTNSALEIYDANGNLVGTGCATGDMTRFE